MQEWPLEICWTRRAGATPERISHDLLGVDGWYIPVVDKLLLRCLDSVEVVAGSAEKGLTSLGDTVTGWFFVLLPRSVMVPLELVKLWLVTGVDSLVPEAKVRSPDVNTVTSGVKGARGPEMGAWPIVTNPLSRVLVRCVRGMFLSVVRAEGPERKKY